MLRECIRFEALTKILLHSEHFYDFFKYVEVSTFDIASDAFATFKVGFYLHLVHRLLNFFKATLLISNFGSNFNLDLVI